MHKFNRIHQVAPICPTTLFRELCKNGSTDRFAVHWVYGFGWAKEAQTHSYSPLLSSNCSFVIQIHLMGGHIPATWRIRLNHSSAAATFLMPNYFDHLLSLDTPTQTVAQIAERFEPNTALWAFYKIQLLMIVTHYFVI